MARRNDYPKIDNVADKDIARAIDDKLAWLRKNLNRVEIFTALNQPMTTTQLARKTDVPRTRCSSVLQSLMKYGLIRRLNPSVKNWCLYWLTSEGARIQKLQMMKLGKEPTRYDFPKLQDWGLYAWCCHIHRAAIIRVLTEPMQPSAIKRKASARNPDLRMSANNVRDVIRLLRIKGIVHSTLVRKKHHPRYELTELGKDIQTLLWRV